MNTTIAKWAKTLYKSELAKNEAQNIYNKNRFVGLNFENCCKMLGVSVKGPVEKARPERAEPVGRNVNEHDGMATGVYALSFVCMEREIISRLPIGTKFTLDGLTLPLADFITAMSMIRCYLKDDLVRDGLSPLEREKTKVFDGLIKYTLNSMYSGLLNDTGRATVDNIAELNRGMVIGALKAGGCTIYRIENDTIYFTDPRVVRDSVGQWTVLKTVVENCNTCYFAKEGQYAINVKGPCSIW